MKPNRKLLAAWNKRNRLRADGRKLRADGYELCDEADKLRSKGEKLLDDGDNLLSDGTSAFINAVLAVRGNTTIDYRPDGSCVLGTGEVLPAPKKEKP